MPHMPSSHPTRTNTLPGELHQIQAYVVATTARIQYLEDILEPSATVQVVEIKRGLKDAHRRLEKLGQSFPVVTGVTKDVWQTYRRLRSLEERLRNGRADSPLKERRIGKAQVVCAMPAAQSSSIGGVQEEGSGEAYYLPTEMASGDLGDAPYELSGVRCSDDAIIERERHLGPDPEIYYMSGALPVEQDDATHPHPIEQESAEEEEYMSALEEVVEEMTGSQLSSVEQDYHESMMIISPIAVPVAEPSSGDAVTDGHYQPHALEDSRTIKYDARVLPNTVHFPDHLTKTRQEVISSVDEEERQAVAGLVDPDRKRQGSADGWLVSLAIMTANPDRRLCVPHLMCIKVHEVRGLKCWLSSMGYLHQSQGLSRTEKMLHLLTLLQMGSRFETIAVMFSRTPFQVAKSCAEVFEGLLQLHSETMLPGRIMSKFLYPHLWHIVGNYSMRRDPRTHELYYPMEAEDICKVLITINIYIGRYRKQGQFSLVGPIMDWGRYIKSPQVSR